MTYPETQEHPIFCHEKMAITLINHKASVTLKLKSAKVKMSKRISDLACTDNGTVIDKIGNIHPLWFSSVTVKTCNVTVQWVKNINILQTASLT